MSGKCPYDPYSGAEAAPVQPAPFEPEFSRPPVPSKCDSEASKPKPVPAADHATKKAAKKK